MNKAPREHILILLRFSRVRSNVDGPTQQTHGIFSLALASQVVGIRNLNLEIVAGPVPWSSLLMCSMQE
jgi:hypothetical protein